MYFILIKVAYTQDNIRATPQTMPSIGGMLIHLTQDAFVNQITAIGFNSRTLLQVEKMMGCIGYHDQMNPYYS